MQDNRHQNVPVVRRQAHERGGQDALHGPRIRDLDPGYACQMGAHLNQKGFGYVEFAEIAVKTNCRRQLQTMKALTTVVLVESTAKGFIFTNPNMVWFIGPIRSWVDGQLEELRN